MQALERLFEQLRDTSVMNYDEYAWRPGTPSGRPNTWATWLPGISPSLDG